jgi:hypothetical protein
MLSVSLVDRFLRAVWFVLAVQAVVFAIVIGAMRGELGLLAAVEVLLAVVAGFMGLIGHRLRSKLRQAGGENRPADGHERVAG